MSLEKREQAQLFLESLAVDQQMAWLIELGTIAPPSDQSDPIMAWSPSLRSAVLGGPQAPRPRARHFDRERPLDRERAA